MLQTIKSTKEGSMTARDFCFWLHGFFEMREDKKKPLTEEQLKMIQDHLHLMFKATVTQLPDLNHGTTVTTAAIYPAENFIC